MNRPRSAVHRPPALTCRLARTFPDSALAHRHAAGCAMCQAQFNAFADLDRRLRDEAAADSPAPPTGLERRIAAAVRTSSVGQEETRGRAIYGGAIAAFAVVALAFIVFRAPSSAPAPAPNLVLERAELRRTAEAISTRVWSSLLSAGEIVDNNALRDEWGLVRSNAQVAWRFLEKNFVPDSLLQPAQSRNG